MTSLANSTQVGGAHYASSIQHWDFVASRKLGYFEGQVTKYVSRWRKKNGAQDLEKAAHFLAKLQELATQGASTPQDTFLDLGNSPLPKIPVSYFSMANQLTVDEDTVVALVTEWGGDLGLLDRAAAVLGRMIAEEHAAPGRNYVNQS